MKRKYILIYEIYFTKPLQNTSRGADWTPSQGFCEQLNERTSMNISQFPLWTICVSMVHLHHSSCKTYLFFKGKSAGKKETK